MSAPKLTVSAADSGHLLPAFCFTRHAVDRFVSRVRPGLDDRTALEMLATRSPHARMMPKRSILGDAMWSIDDPPMRWITRPDTSHDGRRVAVVTTVLSGAEDAAAKEQAEREVLEASRRLEALRELGPEEIISPAPEIPEAWRAWLALETQRLAVERERLRKLNSQELAAVHRARLSLEQTRLAAAQHEASRRERTARHLITQSRDTLLLELLNRLADVDPVGSAELIARTRERVAKWETEGRLMKEQS